MAVQKALFRVPRKQIHTMYQSNTPLQEADKVDLKKAPEKTVTREDLNKISKKINDSDPRINSGKRVVINEFLGNLPSHAQAKKEHGQGYADFIQHLKDNIYKLEIEDGVEEITGVLTEEMLKDLFEHDYNKIGEYLYFLKNDSRRKTGAIIFEDPNKGQYFINGGSNPYKPSFTGGQHLLLPDGINLHKYIPSSKGGAGFSAGEVLDNFRGRLVYSPEAQRMIPTVNFMNQGNFRYSKGLEEQHDYFKNNLMGPLEDIGGGEIEVYPAHVCVTEDGLQYLETKEDALDQVSRQITPERYDALRNLDTLFRQTPIAGHPTFDEHFGAGFIVSQDAYKKANKEGTFDELDETVSFAKLDTNPMPVRLATEEDMSLFEARKRHAVA